MAVVASLQDRETGTFGGDEWGEQDTRFLFCALLALAILDKMDLVDVDKAVAYVKACENFDGSYGRIPGAESHSGQVYTCVGALSVTKRLDLANLDRLGAWLSERQLPNGGLNGRPEKLEDVCYSWWVLSSLAMIDKVHWIDKTKLTNFILRCQVTMHEIHSRTMLISINRTPSMVAFLTGLAIWLMYSILFSALQA